MTRWETIISEHGPAVWQTAYRLLGNRSDADECLQEAFLAAVLIARRGPVRSWPALLKRLATSKGIDYLRHRKGGPVQTADDKVLVTLVSGELGPDLVAQNNELASDLRKALARLPRRQAEVACLRYLSQMDYKEISKELRIDVGNVGVVLSRARETLRDLLKRRGADHG